MRRIDCRAHVLDGGDVHGDDDGQGRPRGQASATIRIHAGNTAPVPAISSPSATKTFAVGETIPCTGSATDQQDANALQLEALRGSSTKHHDTHMHPFLPVTTGNDIPIVGPDPEDFAATDTTYLEIRLTATDSKGPDRDGDEEPLSGEGADHPRNQPTGPARGWA